MFLSKTFRYPDYAAEAFQKARSLEWLTIGYLLTEIVLIYFVMGSSQALQSAWIQEMLSLVPPVAFLIAFRFYKKRPNDRYPYGYHRAFQIAYLSGALAIFLMGVLMVLNSTRALITAQHPTLTSIIVFDRTIWIGWLAIAVLAYKALPAYFIGKRKLKLAKLTEDKILHTDALAQKLSYQTALAAALGILGIGMGWWWADELAAYFISFTVLREGFLNSRIAMLNLMDAYPVDKITDKAQEDIEEIQQEVEACEWIKEAQLRMRMQGHVLFGEILIVPVRHDDLLDKMDSLHHHIQQKYWRVHDLIIAPVRQLPSSNH